MLWPGFGRGGGVNMRAAGRGLSGAPAVAEMMEGYTLITFTHT